MVRKLLGSLRSRLVLLVLVAVLPALGLMLYTASEERRRAIADVRRDAQRLVRLAAGTQEQIVEGARQLLLAMARFPEMRGADPARCLERIAELPDQYPFYVNLAVAHGNGDLFCSAVAVAAPVTLAERPWFQRAVRSRNFSVGDYEIDFAAGVPVLHFTYPVLDESGAVRNVIIASLDLNQVNKLANETPLPEESALIVIDSNGTVVARRPDPETWVGRTFPEGPLVRTILERSEGAFDGAGMDGVARLWAFTPLRSTTHTGLYASIGIPTAVAFGEANRVLARNLSWLGVAALLVLAAAWFGSNLFILRRVKALVKASRRLADGDLKSRTGLPYGAGELDQLARVFDEMAEALERRAAQLREAEVKYRTLVEQMPAVTYIAALDERMGKLYISPQIGPLLGFSPERWLADPERWVKQIHPDDRIRVLEEVRRCHATGEPFSSEYRMLDSHGRLLWFRDEAIVVRDEAEQPQFLQGVMLDTTERKQAEEALRESEERYRKIVDTAQEGIWVLDAEGRTSYLNQRMAEMLGCNLQTVLGHSFSRFLAEGERGEGQRWFQRLAQGANVHQDLRFRREDGSTLWSIVNSSPLFDEQGHFVGALNMVADISERKAMEEQLRASREQLRGLASHLQTVREEERSWIAREIHDELGQALTGLKMDLSWLDKRLSGTGGHPPSGPLLRERIASMSELLDATIQSVRKISTELRPGVLDNLGLTAAIEWQVGDFQARTGILCEFDSFAEEIQTDPERSTALFRICQEILTNVARHANATEVRISLREEADGVVLELRDNGRGITEGEIRGKGSLGLLGMRERAERLGGEFVIRGLRGGGTMVRVRIPCAGPESRAVSEGLNGGEAHDPVSGG